MFERGHCYIGWQVFCKWNAVGQDVRFWDLCAVWTMCFGWVPVSAGKNVVVKVGYDIRNGAPECLAW